MWILVDYYAVAALFLYSDVLADCFQQVATLYLLEFWVCSFTTMKFFFCAARYSVMRLDEAYTLLQTKICGLTKNFQPLYMWVDMCHSLFHCCIFLSRLWIRKAVLILWPNDNSPFESEHWFLIILIPLVCFIVPAVTNDEIKPLAEVLSAVAPSPTESNVTSASGNEKPPNSSTQIPLSTDFEVTDPVDQSPDSLRSILEELVGRLEG